jgi:hypothetical protein
MQPFPNIEEYDVLIIDLSTLSQEVLDRLSTEQPGKLEGMVPSIMKILSTGRNVFCVLQPYLFMTRPPGSSQASVSPPLNNYSWMPERLMLSNKKGESIGEPTESFLGTYFNQVDEWFVEIQGLVEPAPEIWKQVAESYAEALRDSFGSESPKAPEFETYRISSNKSGAMIAAKLCVKGWKSGIYLLPPTTRCNLTEGIEILIDCVLGPREDNRPSWWGTIAVPGLGSKKDDIKSMEADVEKVESDLAKLGREKASLERYRGALTLDGSGLVDIVQKMLADIGFVTRRTNPGYPVDLIGRGKIAVVVTGTVDKIETGTPKILQVATFAEKHRRGEKVIVVANTYRRLPPSSRKGKIHFTPQVADYFKSANVCAMTTVTFFELWAKVIERKAREGDIRRLILSTDGVLT